MQSLRSFLLRHRTLALLAIAAALCMKVMVPAGTMLASDSKVLTLQLCDESLSHGAVKQIAIPMKQDGESGAAKQTKDHCPYAGMAKAQLAGADPVLLALVLAFIVALGFAAIPAPPARRTARLLPPLRGPPALA